MLLLDGCQLKLYCVRLGPSLDISGLRLFQTAHENLGIWQCQKCQHPVVFHLLVRLHHPSSSRKS